MDAWRTLGPYRIAIARVGARPWPASAETWSALHPLLSPHLGPPRKAALRATRWTEAGRAPVRKLRWDEGSFAAWTDAPGDGRLVAFEAQSPPWVTCHARGAPPDAYFSLRRNLGSDPSFAFTLVLALAEGDPVPIARALLSRLAPRSLHLVVGPFGRAAKAGRGDAHGLLEALPTWSFLPPGGGPWTRRALVP